jgi:hypothetical protein
MPPVNEDALDEAIRELRAAVVAEVEAAEVHRAAGYRRRAATDALTGLGRGDPEFTLSTARRLYWEAPEVTVSAIGALLGLGRSQIATVHRLVGPWTGPCPECAHPVTWISRQDRQLTSYRCPNRVRHHKPIPHLIGGNP